MTRVNKMSRREFLGTTGAAGAGLVLGCSLTRPSQVVYQPNAFLAIEPAGGVTIWTAKSEMGQGVKTALSMIVADELDANWEDVVVRQADYEPSLRRPDDRLQSQRSNLVGAPAAGGRNGQGDADLGGSGAMGCGARDVPHRAWRGEPRTQRATACIR